MKKPSLWLTALFIISFFTGDVSAQRFGRRRRGRFGDASRYGWRSSYRDAKAEARKTGKPLMVVFRCVP